MKAHGRVFWMLGIMQRFWYRSDGGASASSAICRDNDVQQLTWDAYMNKELGRRGRWNSASTTSWDSTLSTSVFWNHCA